VASAAAKPDIEEALNRLMNFISVYRKSESVVALLREVEILRMLSCDQIDPVSNTVVLLDRYARVVEEHRRDSPVSQKVAELVAYAVLYLHKKHSECRE